MAVSNIVFLGVGFVCLVFAWIWFLTKPREKKEKGKEVGQNGQEKKERSKE